MNKFTGTRPAKWTSPKYTCGVRTNLIFLESLSGKKTQQNETIPLSDIN